MKAWSLFQTSFGDGAVVVRSGRIERILLPEAVPSAGRGVQAVAGPDAERDSPESRQFARELRLYFEGDGVPADLLDAIHWPKVPAFTRTIMEACARIPRGKVTTYAGLAADAGYDGSRYGRPTGQVMAKNPLPLVIPCHRVLDSDRRANHYGGGVPMKLHLLEREGVRL